MAFTVEDGTGIATANSYASTAEADAYFSDRSNATWSAAVIGDKQAALIKATAFIDGIYYSRFRGLYPIKSTQALQWPRTDALDRRGYFISGIPGALKAGVFEAAVLMLTDDLTAPVERGGQVRRVKVGPVEQEFEPNAPADPLYQAIDNALRPLLVGGGGQIRLGRA